MGLINLNVSKNLNLTNIARSRNQLSSLDIYSNTSLLELICYMNSLTSLDILANEYTLEDWTEEGVGISTKSNYLFTAIVNRDLIANFTKNKNYYCNYFKYTNYVF